MPKIRKRTSKRVNLRTKYSVLHKVSEHHKKLRRQATRMVKAGIKPNKLGKKESAIPNSFPDKENLVNAIEAQHLAEQEEKMDLIKANKLARKGNEYIMEQEMKAQVDKEEEDENAKTGGLTAEQIEEAEWLMDPESALKAANISKKQQWRETKKVIEMSDVLLQVLDARDPEGTRIGEIEEYIKEQGKKIIFIINKWDLIPEDVAADWQKHYKNCKQISVLFRGNHINKGKKPKHQDNKEDDEEMEAEGSESEEFDNGQEKVMTVLYKYAKKFMEKKEQETINVGVVGYPNVGKSSVINVLKNKVVVASGSHPFITRSIQTVKLNKHVNLVDSPGALVPQEGNENKIIRSALQVEDLPDPIKALEQILLKVDKSEILRMYRIGNYQNTDEMLDQIALKKGLVEQVRVDGKTEKKGKKSKAEKKDVPQKVDAARRVMRDFLNNRINYHVAPPKVPKATK